MSIRARSVSVAMLAVLISGGALRERLIAQREQPRAEWRYYSGDNGSTKYSPLDQIDRSNVASLKVAWRRPQVDASLLQGTPVRLLNNFRSTPIMVGGILFASNGVGLAEAFDPETGKTLWVQKPNADGMRGSANRGVAYWGEGADARIITFRNRYLYALNPKTGEPIASFGNGGVVDLGADVGPRSSGYRWNSVPLVARDVIVMGSAIPATCAPTTSAPASCGGHSTSYPPPTTRLRSRPGSAIRGNTPAPATCGR